MVGETEIFLPKTVRTTAAILLYSIIVYDNE